MRKAFVLALVFLIGGVSSALAEEEGWTGNVNFFLGAKALDDDDWEPVEEHGEIGVSIDFRQREWPINIVVEYLHSASGEEEAMLCDPSFGCVNVEAEAETSELNLGIRKIWETSSSVRPFIGGGLSLINAELSVDALGTETSESDSGVGFWFGGGVYWTIGDHFNLGLEAKISSADVDFEGIEADAGGGHFGFIAGYHW